MINNVSEKFCPIYLASFHKGFSANNYCGTVIYYKKYIFGSSSLFLAQSSPNLWNSLSVESDKGVFVMLMRWLWKAPKDGGQLPKKPNRWGLPWWHSGWESACQCRGHRFEPWSGKIPHAAEQLGPWATTTEPAHLEPVLHNKRGRNSERPAHHDEEWPLLAATRESPRTETKTQHSQK